MDISKVNTDKLYDKHIRPVHPNGEHTSSQITFLKAFQNNVLRNEEDVITIAKRYKSYVDQWHITYSGVSEAYIAKENRIKSFKDFFMSGMHKSESFSKMDARYIYLFGQVEYGKIKEKFQAFKKRTESPYNTNS